MTLRERLEEAALMAMRLRAGDMDGKRWNVELQVVPVGIKICVMGDRENKQLIGWQQIEMSAANVVCIVMMAMTEVIGIPDTLHDHGNARPRWR